MKTNCTKPRYCHRHPKTLKIKLALWSYLFLMFFATAGVCFDRQCLADKPTIISPLVAHAQTTLHPELNKARVSESAVSPAKADTPSPTQSGSSPEQERDNNEVKKIDEYIDTIFGPKDGRIMRAVNRVECNPKNKAYPKCVYHTEHEYSVGIFQINLYNAKQWIHAKKVPGETMEEKIESLKDPYINTLVAYKIFQDSSFTPWAGFTSNRYLEHLDK